MIRSISTKVIFWNVKSKLILTDDVVVFVEEVASCLPHPGALVGTKETAVSLPLCSAFKDGKFTGPRLVLGTLPRDCMPYLCCTVLFCCCFSKGSP